MKKSSRKILLVLVAIFVVLFLVWRYLGGEAAVRDESPDLIANRVWVDRQPEKFTDQVNAFLMIDDARLGIFQEASQWAGRYELFEYRRQGSTADLKFPQDGREAAVDYTVTSCNELHPFDLCLDLRENPWGGPIRYYGMRNDGSDDQALERLEERLRAMADR